MPDLLLVALFGLWVYCMIDVLVSDADKVRSLPKWAWFLCVALLFFGLGPILWLLVGRPPRAFTGGYEGDSVPARAPRSTPVRRLRPPTKVDRQEEVADIEARIVERDRLLAQWAEEDRLKSGSPPDRAAPGPETP